MAIIDLLQDKLYLELDEWARHLILSEDYRCPQDPFRQTYADSPDSIDMHAPNWHQWGVISHTRQVGLELEKSVPAYLELWFGKERAHSRLGLLEEEVDGIDKWRLLLCSVPCHDWGKFTVRFPKMGSGANPGFHFGGHEHESGRLVRLRQSWFHQQGLSPKQLEYLACCAELHFELGKVRDRSRDGATYGVHWLESSRGHEALHQVKLAWPNFWREIGLYFLADNWGKTDLMTTKEYHEIDDIKTLEQSLIRAIDKRQLEKNLLDAALQLPTNTAVGKAFLKMQLEDTPGM